MVGQNPANLSGVKDSKHSRPSPFPPVLRNGFDKGRFRSPFSHVLPEMRPNCLLDSMIAYPKGVFSGGVWLGIYKSTTHIFLGAAMAQPNGNPATSTVFANLIVLGCHLIKAWRPWQDERSFLSLGMIPGTSFQGIQAHGLIALHPEIYILRKAATKVKVIHFTPGQHWFQLPGWLFFRKFYYVSWFVSYIPDTLRFRHDFYHGRWSQKFRVTWWTLELVSVTCMQGRKIQSKILHAYYSVPKNSAHFFKGFQHHPSRTQTFKEEPPQLVSMWKALGIIRGPLI